jgi:hypothetical protein
LGAGGLIADNSGDVTACYANASIHGTYSVGGRVGENSGSITASYATGFISNYGGGLVGATYYGAVITACFWDMQTSSRVDSSGGIGLTTEQMKTMSIFQNADWADQGWVMKDGFDYPHLSWENAGGDPIPPAIIPLSGNGTWDDPSLVSTPQEFALLRRYTGILDKRIKLTADLDMSGIELAPIGDLGPFYGIFEGDGHSINNVKIYMPDRSCVGLFSCVYGGLITNMGVNHADITGYSDVGAIAGSNFGLIKTCYATGKVSGDFVVGGLVGGNNSFGEILACYAACMVSGDRYSGGLVGENDGTITDSYSIGSVVGQSYIGGLVGKNDSKVKSSFWDVQTSGQTG